MTGHQPTPAEPTRRLGLRRRVLTGAAVALAAMVGPVVAVPAAQASTREVQIPVITLSPGQTEIRTPGTATAAATIASTATLSGHLDVWLFGPTDPTCSGTPAASWEKPLTGTSGLASVSYSLAADAPAGTWHWLATYDGDAANATGRTACVALSVNRTQPWEPFASAEALVTRQFLDVVGRYPTADDLALWTPRITDGSYTAGELVSYLRGSADNLNSVDPNVRLYRAYFLRIPDLAGLRYWINASRNGRALVDTSNFFALSPEFNARYGALGNADFVALVYLNVLGRTGDTNGMAFWTSQLDGGVRSRGDVMIGFSESPEYRNAQASEVTAIVLYNDLLGHMPDRADFDAAVTLLDLPSSSGIRFTVANLADELMRTTEYRSHVASA